MSSLNQVTLIGNLGKKPEVLKETPKGKFVRLQLATTEKYRNAKKEVVEDTQWHDIRLNNSAGTFAATYLQTGDKVMVTGRLRYSKWEDKKGVIKYSTTIQAKECRILSSKTKHQQEVLANAKAEVV